MEHKKNNQSRFSLSRRNFVKAVGATSAAAMFAGCSKDSNPAGPSEEVIPPLPDSSQVARIEAKSFDKSYLKSKLADALDQIGGLSDICKSGDTVGIKINLTGGISSANSWKKSTGVDAVDSFWTNPILTLAVGELFKDAGASKIYLIEGYYDWDSVRIPGFNDVAGYLGGDIIDLNQAAPYTEYAKRTVGSRAQIYQELYQNPIFDDIDCFVSIPKAKQHVSAGVTHAMKNLVGTLPQPRYSLNGSGSRQAIHNHDDKYDGKKNDNLCRVVLDLNLANKIHLAVNDAIKTTVGGEGPWCGSMRNATFNKLIVSKDAVAADTISTQVIGFDPWAADYTDTFALPSDPCINYLRKAEELSMGNHSQSKIDVIDIS